MMELCQASARTQTDNSRALVVVKDAAIKAKLKELGIEFGRSRYRRDGNLDDSAYAAGAKAGEHAGFGRPLEGKSGMLRLARK
jgi:hypothetical protein